MQLIQILGAAFLISLAGMFIFNVLTGLNYQSEVDRYGRRHKRDIKTGRFVKIN